MNVQMLLIYFLKVALVESFREVSGYLGETVILPSGADPSWRLSLIQWSIFPNITWIATNKSGKMNTERVDRYKGRLRLNASSGDLTIHNLTSEDSMEYTVQLSNTEGKNSGQMSKLTVRQHLQKPTIEYQNTSCTLWLWLHCSSADEGVKLSWQRPPPNVTVRTYQTNAEGNYAFLEVNLNTTQGGIEFTCTASRNLEETSRVVTLTCGGDKPQTGPTPDPTSEPSTQPRLRYGVVFLLGSVPSTLILMYFVIEKRRPVSDATP